MAKKGTQAVRKKPGAKKPMAKGKKKAGNSSSFGKLTKHSLYESRFLALAGNGDTNSIR